MGTSFAIILTLTVLALDLVLFLLTFILKALRKRRHRRQSKHDQYIGEQLLAGEIDDERIEPDDLFSLFKRLQEAVSIPMERQENIARMLLDSYLPNRYMKQLQSRFRLKRIEAAANLRYLQREDIQQALLGALRTERDTTVALYIGQALAIQKDTRAIIPLISHIRRSSPWMAGRLRAVLYTYEEKLLPYLLRRVKNTRRYMQQIICGFAIAHPSEQLRAYLVELGQSERAGTRRLALKALRKHFPEELVREPFTSSKKNDILVAVIHAISILPGKHRIATILTFSRRKALHEHIVQSLSDMTYREPAVLGDILTHFKHTKSSRNKELLAKVLDRRIDYYLVQITGPLHDQIVELIRELVRVKQTSGIIFFLNRNQEPTIEKTVVQILRPLLKKNQTLHMQIVQYLDARMVKEFKIRFAKKYRDTPAPHAEPPPRLRLALTLIGILMMFPLVILASEFTTLVSLSWQEIGRLYIVRFNYLLVYYSVTINLIYLLVLAISVRGAKVQARLWDCKDTRLLFTDQLLPAVSIIAPAYNEAGNIIESVNSLLNQRYPEFELIVVNDGSKDETLNTLIKYFNLEKRDRLIPRRLNTRPIRGIYTNKNIPNLIIVDKVNGGKADSLNLGLNVASKEFFCGIDADSLLEPEALLKAVSAMIDSSEETIATGGNICPVNGCTVELGSLDVVALPKNFLARLQSLEYMRAFMSGRVGWSHMNLLLIISGAFGVFNRERTIQTGGYLTKSGKYRKDTVGEDMELVVRLSRYMRELKKPYRVKYAFNANCWTEVPESWKTLHRQRDRWHRGLVDILLFHSAMIANPRYGRLGMVGMAYYFIFELVGPFIEAQGLLLVVLSIFLGIINLPIALMLFTATILLGILVSISSVLVNELDHEMYATDDVLRLLGMAILENFGIRQIISLWRVGGFFSAMRKNRGWGAQVRKGFGATKPVKASNARTKKH